MSKKLVVYYSYSNGNTKRIAERVKDKTAADILRIDTVKPYEGTYDEIVAQGKRECDSSFTPEIKPSKVDLSAYDTIIIGTPTWWYTMSPAILSFMRNNDFKGKTVIPFMTNAGWRGNVIKNMTKEAVGANVILPLEVKFDSGGGDNLETPMKKIDEWIDKINSEG